MTRLHALLPLLVALAGCASSAVPAPSWTPAVAAPGAGSVVVRARDTRFVMPARWPAGWIGVTLLNDGGQPHQLQLARLHPGTDPAQVRDEFATDPAAAFSALTLAGGPDVVEPGLGQQVTLLLDPGRYVALDLAVGSDGIQNVRKGMFAAFTVGGRTRGAPPPAAASLVERSFSYDVPALPGGRVVLQVRNQSPEDAHEAAIVRPLPGKALEDVLEFLDTPSGPPPFRFVGGMAALEPGEAGYLDLDLDPGPYVILCSVTDPDTGRFHFDMGMTQILDVGRQHG